MTGDHGIPRSSEHAVRAAQISLAVGVLILAAKVVAWLWTGSVALFSDAMESIVNVVAAGAAVVALRVARTPPDAEHPFGHAKAEYFSAVLEGVLIILAAGAIGWEAVGRLLHVEPIHSLGPGLALSMGATAANGGLAWFLVRRGRALSSPALLADGKHIAADVVTSVGVAVGVALAWATGWWILDPILALAVAANVVRTGVQVVRDSLGGLMDESLAPDELTTVENTIRAYLGEQPLEVHDLRTRRAAAVTFIEFHLIVPGTMTVCESHEICDRLEQALAEAVPGSRTQIHVEPETEALHRGRVSGPAH